MKSRMRLLFSAVIAMILIIITANFGLNAGKQSKIKNEEVKEAAQSQVVVQDFIHDNYVISEKNPWTDYDLHPVEYRESTSTFSADVKAKAAVLVDLKTKNILYGKNMNEKRSPASTTKLMTALTVLQVMNLNSVVVVGSEVDMIASDSSKAGFSKGQVATVEELLNGMLICSGNDAAYILAKATGKEIFANNIANEGKKFTDAQCVERFVLEMNKNVRDMKLENTHFTSPDGYDDSRQYTTASDLSKIAIAAYSNKTIAKICKRRNYKSETLCKIWTSTNELLNKDSSYYYPYCMGLKTGSTDSAGKCLVSVGKKDSAECISVVLGDDSDEQRWNDTRELLRYGLE